MKFAKNRLNKFYNPKLYKAPPKTELSREDSMGVMAMMDLLIADLDKEMTEASTQEKDSQADYENLMKESSNKRKVDTGVLTEKTGVKADLEASVEETSDEKASAEKELMATDKF